MYNELSAGKMAARIYNRDDNLYKQSMIRYHSRCKRIATWMQSFVTCWGT
ncbi:MAG: hypothetical protein NC306_07125 [Butyrivibrio sp.]|nr:hypothetical protein [Butyrivibrio sp.]